MAKTKLVNVLIKVGNVAVTEIHEWECPICKTKQRINLDESTACKLNPSPFGLSRIDTFCQNAECGVQVQVYFEDRVDQLLRSPICGAGDGDYCTIEKCRVWHKCPVTLGKASITR